MRIGHKNSQKSLIFEVYLQSVNLIKIWDKRTTDQIRALYSTYLEAYVFVIFHTFDHFASTILKTESKPTRNRFIDTQIYGKIENATAHFLAHLHVSNH